MRHLSNYQNAIEELTQFGLKEYEAESFVALTALEHGTAKDISNISDVPRTRVYDAVRVLESKGLVEIQHTSPQRFRAIPIEEAISILTDEFESRSERLLHALEGIENAHEGDETDSTHEVWALSGTSAISHRTNHLIRRARREIFLIIGDPAIWSASLQNQLAEALRADISVIIGSTDSQFLENIRSELPGAEVFTSKLSWLEEDEGLSDTSPRVSRLLLVDDSTILVSTRKTKASGEDVIERAVFSKGFENGVVVILRRLMGRGLSDGDDRRIQ